MGPGSRGRPLQALVAEEQQHALVAEEAGAAVDSGPDVLLAGGRPQHALVADEAGVAVDQGLVGTGLDHLRLVGAEGAGSAGQDLDLHVMEDTERSLELCIAG